MNECTHLWYVFRQFLHTFLHILTSLNASCVLVERPRQQLSCENLAIVPGGRDSATFQSFKGHLKNEWVLVVMCKLAEFWANSLRENPRDNSGALSRNAASEIFLRAQKRALCGNVQWQLESKRRLWIYFAPIYLFVCACAQNQYRLKSMFK